MKRRCGNGYRGALRFRMRGRKKVIVALKEPGGQTSLIIRRTIYLATEPRSAMDHATPHAVPMGSFGTWKGNVVIG